MVVQRLIIDEAAATLTMQRGDVNETVPLYSDAAFEAIARQYIRVGWNQKHCYTFSWMGRPVIQFPDDLLRMQELVHELRPDLLVETGVAHGGSLVFYASLMAALGRGQVLGIDIDIRPPARAALEAHPLFERIALHEGDSVSAAALERAREAARGAATVLVVLDSNHSHAHVSAELDAYASLVTPGSYLVATDGVMRELAGVPRAGPGWEADNPASAAEDWARRHPEFELAPPPWPFNESTLKHGPTHFTSAYLRRR